MKAQRNPASTRVSTRLQKSVFNGRHRWYGLERTLAKAKELVAALEAPSDLLDRIGAA
jgi:hypothetical protein